MLYLRTLGGLHLEADDGRTLGPSGTYRKRLALLAVIAASGDLGVSRDKLILYFWPDSEESRARRTLAQALYALRHDLGEDDLFLGTSELRLNPGSIRSDVCDLRCALTRQDYRRALELYAGPFLDGVNLSDVPDFERWLDVERARIARQVSDALKALATAAEAGGDCAAAAEWWRALLEQDRLNTSVAVRLVKSLAKAGDTSAALAAAKAHRDAFERELGLGPDSSLAAAVSEIVERVRSSRPISLPTVPAVFTTPGTDDIGAPLRAAIAGPPPASASQPPSRLRWVAYGAVVVLIVASSVAMFRSARSANAAFVVYPFSVSGATHLEYLSKGIPDLVARDLVVDSTERSISAADATPPDADALRAIGRKTHARGIVVGSVVGDSAHLVIKATLIDARSGGTIGMATADGSAATLDELSARLSARLLAMSVHAPARRAEFLASEPLTALREFLRAEREAGNGRADVAAERYQAALAVDSSFGYAALGLIHVANSDAAGARNLLPRALALAWADRARMADADADYVRAVVGPSYPASSSMAAYLSAWKKAVESAPERAETWLGLAFIYYNDGFVLGAPRPVESARVAFEHALELNPQSVETLLALVDVDARLGDQRAVARDAARLLAIDSAGPIATRVRWYRSLVLGDSAEHARVVSALDTVPLLTLRWIVQTSLDATIGVADAVRAIDAWKRRKLSIAEQTEEVLAEHALALARGRRREASQIMPRLAELEPDDYLDLRFPILAALYGDGDSSVATRAASAAMAHYGFANARPLNDEALEMLCVLAQWRLRQSDSAFVRHAIETLRRSRSTQSAGEFAYCAALLSAGTTSSRSVRGAQLERLDSIVAHGESVRRAFPYASLAGARAWFAAGHPDRALTLVRRRGYFGRWPYYIGESLEDEVRYALAAGDGAAAWCALRRLSALRLGADAAVAQRDGVLAAEVRRAHAAAPATCVDVP